MDYIDLIAQIWLRSYEEIMDNVGVNNSGKED